MSKKANMTAIGVFVVGALILLIAGIAVFGSGSLFKRADKYVLFFDGSVKGLSAGAPVVFRGVKIGSVKSVNLIYDPATMDVYIPVVIEVELSRVKGLRESIGYPKYGTLAAEGLRAKLDIQSFVTGQLLVSFDFYHDNPLKLVGVKTEYPELPTIPMSKDIFATTQELPVKDIANNIKEATAGISKLVNSEGFRRLENAIAEITETARSLRLFLEYLEQHPEALLTGKQNPKGE